MSALAKALVAAQKAMPEVPKSAKANYGMYATLDDLIAKTRPVLNENGLSIQQFPHVGEQGQPVLRTIIRHESGETESGDTPLILAKQDMQALGAAITYARRYAWGAALGIASEHDDDAASIVSDARGGERTGAQTEREAAASRFQPPPGAAGDGNGFAASRADAVPPDDGGDPLLVRIHFGTNSGKTLGELSQRQREWYATKWEPNPQYADEHDRRLKMAAQILCGLEPVAAAVDDGIPF